MVKVSITLPNNAQITFESEEPGVVEQVIKMVLRDLPRELMGSIHGGDGDPAPPEDWEKSTSVVTPASPEITIPERSFTPETKDGPAGPDAPPAPARRSPDTSEASSALATPTPSPRRGPAKKSDSEAEEAFVEFCRLASPMGDMRKVVVAAEGASRSLSMDSVDAQDLERLFALAGWSSPHSFIQTLRNAARSKFRWLERLPGRSGRYTVTDVGRATTLTQ